MIDRILDGAGVMVHWLAERVPLPLALAIACFSTVGVFIYVGAWPAVIGAATGTVIALVLAESGR